SEIPAAKRQKIADPKENDDDGNIVSASSPESLPQIPRVCVFCYAQCLLALRRTSKFWKDSVDHEVSVRSAALIKMLPQNIQQEVGDGKGKMTLQNGWSEGYLNREAIADTLVKFARPFFQVLSDTYDAFDWEETEGVLRNDLIGRDAIYCFGEDGDFDGPVNFMVQDEDGDYNGPVKFMFQLTNEESGER
ncbi:MAG: hypothetical protein SGARI_003283, partial [Bacillariaceae sp.]